MLDETSEVGQDQEPLGTVTREEGLNVGAKRVGSSEDAWTRGRRMQVEVGKTG